MHINQGVSEELFRLFGNIGQAMHDSASKPLLNQVQYTILVALTRSPRRGSDLVAILGLDQSTVSRRIAALSEAGLLQRVPDPEDGRAHLLSATDEGIAMVERERARRVRSVTDALDDWPEADRADLARLLGQLNTSLGRRRARTIEGLS